MSSLGKQPVARKRRRSPRYPRALAATLLLGASCSPHSGTDTARAPEPPAYQQPVAVASAVPATEPVAAETVAPPVADSAAPIASSVPEQTEPVFPEDIDLTIGAPAVFPEDDNQMPMVGCGGACPPQWQLQLNAKDQQQLDARLRFCVKAAVKHGLNKNGTLAAKVEITPWGKPTSVSTDESVKAPVAVRACAEKLIPKILFKTSHNYARTASSRVPLVSSKP